MVAELHLPDFRNEKFPSPRQIYLQPGLRAQPRPAQPSYPVGHPVAPQ